jgi:hypothetical protein
MKGFPKRPNLKRLPLGAVLVIGMLGCTVKAEQVLAPTPKEGSVSSVGISRLLANAGKLNGTVSATSDVLALAGVSSLSEATVTAYDPDGTKLGEAIPLNADGTFSLGGLKASRPRIFVEVSVNNVYLRAVTEAPRLATGSYEVVLDAGTTFLADKLRRAALDQEVPFDRLDEQKVGTTEEVVSLYLNDASELRTKSDALTRGTLGTADGQANLDLNAHLFDRFTDDHPPVKLAIYALSPGILRGWRPSPSPKATFNSPDIVATPTPRPSASPTGTPSPEASVK